MQQPTDGKNSGVIDRPKTRMKKSANSKEFNDLLSSANQLSVNERTRLIKSLAGQLGYIVVKPAVGGQPPVSNGDHGRGRSAHGSNAVVRANPLRGTAFEQRLEAAKLAVKRAKEELKVNVLEVVHPAMQEYTAALKSFREEKAKLKPVGGVANPSAKAVKRDRSPEPMASSNAEMDIDASAPTSKKKASGVVQALSSVLSSSSPKKKSSGGDAAKQ